MHMLYAQQPCNHVPMQWGDALYQARSEHIWSGQARMWVWSNIVGVVSQSGCAWLVKDTSN